MSAPNLLRVGAKENIFVECQDCTGGDILVKINVMNHPTKANTLATTSVTLNSGNDFQAFGEIKVNKMFSEEHLNILVLLLMLILLSIHHSDPCWRV